MTDHEEQSGIAQRQLLDAMRTVLANTPERIGGSVCGSLRIALNDAGWMEYDWTNDPVYRAVNDLEGQLLARIDPEATTAESSVGAP